MMKNDLPIHDLPVHDVITTEAWRTLRSLAPLAHLHDLCAEDPGRAERFTRDAASAPPAESASPPCGRWAVGSADGAATGSPHDEQKRLSRVIGPEHLGQWLRADTPRRLPCKGDDRSWKAPPAGWRERRPTPVDHRAWGEDSGDP